MSGMINTDPKHISNFIPKDLIDEGGIRKLLEEPFKPDQIKYRPGNFGKSLAYIEGHEVIKRLNLAFQCKWSFEVVHWEVKETEVLVIGKLASYENSVVKMAFGGSQITTNSDTGEIISVVDDLKSAATDALKKAASMLGVGLHLYENGNGHNGAPSKGNGNGGGSSSSNNNQSDPKNGNGNGNGNGSSRLTAKQLAAIYAISKARGLSKDDVQRMSIQAFDRMPDFITKSDASIFIQNLQNVE